MPCRRSAVCPCSRSSRPPAIARAQGAPLTLQQAVTQATDRYPSVRAAAAQVSAATANAALARDAYLPRADVVWQMLVEFVARCSC